MGQGLPPELHHNSPPLGVELAVAVATSHHRRPPSPCWALGVPARPCSRRTVTLPRIHGSLCSVDNLVEVHAPSDRLLLLGYGAFVQLCFEPSPPLTPRPKALVYVRYV
jgi:hypothetical protein